MCCAPGYSQCGGLNVRCQRRSLSRCRSRCLCTETNFSSLRPYASCLRDWVLVRPPYQYLLGKFLAILLVVEGLALCCA